MENAALRSYGLLNKYYSARHGLLNKLLVRENPEVPKTAQAIAIVLK